MIGPRSRLPHTHGLRRRAYMLSVGDWVSAAAWMMMMTPSSTGSVRKRTIAWQASVVELSTCVTLCVARRPSQALWEHHLPVVRPYAEWSWPEPKQCVRVPRLTPSGQTVSSLFRAFVPVQTAGEFRRAFFASHVPRRAVGGRLRTLRGAPDIFVPTGQRGRRLQKVGRDGESLASKVYVDIWLWLRDRDLTGKLSVTLCLRLAEAPLYY